MAKYEIEPIEDKENSDDVILNAVEYGKVIGSLRYKTKSSGGYELFSLENQRPTKGGSGEVGLDLLKSFVSRVGSGAEVSGLILNYQTRKLLFDEGYVSQAKGVGLLEVTSGLEKFPFVRGLQVAGIVLEKLTLNYQTNNLNDEWCIVSFSAHVI